jgi:histone H3/H4
MSQILVVASKVKAFIKEKSGMNTSASVMEALSKVIERECEKAIENAKRDKRKTVMDRDFS